MKIFVSFFFASQIPKFRPKIGLTKCSFQTIQKLDMLWMMTASNRPHKVLLWVHMGCSGWWRPQILAENQPHKVLHWVHNKAWVILDDDGLKLGSFSLKSASQSAALSPYKSLGCSGWWRPKIGLTKGCLGSKLKLGLFWMMTASNWEVSAENRPHKVLLWVHTNAWVVLDDDGLKLGSFGRKSASQSAALSPY